MDTGQLAVEDAGERRRLRRVGVHDCAGVVAAVDAQVQVELRGGGEAAAEHAAVVQGDDGDLVGPQGGERRAGRGDRHAVAVACADVAGRPDDEAVGRQAPRRRGHLLALGLQVVCALHLGAMLT